MKKFIKLLTIASFFTLVNPAFAEIQNEPTNENILVLDTVFETTENDNIQAIELTKKEMTETEGAVHPVIVVGVGLALFWGINTYAH